MTPEEEYAARGHAREVAALRDRWEEHGYTGFRHEGGVYRLSARDGTVLQDASAVLLDRAVQDHFAEHWDGRERPSLEVPQWA